MINIYMKDAYTNAFYDIVRETQEQRGYELPTHLEAYIVMLLSSYVEHPYFEPTNSFAEQYLQLSTKMDAKKLGDTCLFVSSVFPTYGERHGLNKFYYAKIGQGSYNSMGSELFEQLATHFIFLRDFIEMSLHVPKSPYRPL